MRIQQINPVVLVQPLGRAIAAGEVKINGAAWEIQATCGLGMSLPRGETIPDYYQVQPETGAVKFQRLGYKTLAYDLKADGEKPLAQQQLGNFSAFPIPDSPFLISDCADSCVEVLALEEKAQTEYVLEESQLQKIIKASKQIIAEYESDLILDWTIEQTENSGETQLYFTQIRFLPGEKVTPKRGVAIAPARTPAILRGLAPPREKPKQLPKLSLIPTQKTLNSWLEAFW